MLKLCYQSADAEIEFLQLTTESTGLVGGVMSTGDFADELGGATEIPVYSIGTMGMPGPGKPGIAGKGQMGHKLPTLLPDEVELFNLLERARIQGETEQSIQIFNERMERNLMTVFYTNTESES